MDVAEENIPRVLESSPEHHGGKAVLLKGRVSKQYRDAYNKQTTTKKTHTLSKPVTAQVTTDHNQGTEFFVGLNRGKELIL